MKGTDYMKVLKTTVMVAVLTVTCAAGPGFAQTPPPATPPAPPQTQPPATPPAQPPTTQKPAPPATPQALAPQPQPPKPFPEGAKVGLINLQAIASVSIEGKAATARIQEFVKKKTAELSEKNKQAQSIQTKLQQGATVLNDQARTQAEKDLQRMQRELQALQEDAQQEQQDMTQRLQVEFQERLNPIIEQVATEKGLHVVLNVDQNSNVVWGYSGVDISAEVIKRFDAAPKTAPKK